MDLGISNRKAPAEVERVTDMKWTRQLLGRSNQKGVALLIAIFSVVIITYLVTEILYETNVEYSVNAQAVSRVKAYYAAKAGLDISLLRIKYFMKIQKQLGSQLPADKKHLLDMIWSFPFAWPPLVPEEASGVDKDMIKDKVKESLLDTSYVTTISDEGSKIDLNDLASPSKGIRDITKKLLLQIFENKIQNDEAWSRTHRDLKYEEVVNNIIDWVDDDKESLNGGDEHQLYADTHVEELPPNRGFRTLDEVRLVAGVTEEIFNLLKDRVTIYGMKAINPNYAPLEVIKALDASITDEVAQKVVARRGDEKAGGPFKDEGDFWNYVNAEGGNVLPDVQKSYFLVFDQVINFRIRSTGESGNISREIEAVVYDFNGAALSVATQLQNESNGTTGGSSGASGASGSTGGQGSSSNKSNNSNDPLPKGPPRIVYFMER